MFPTALTKKNQRKTYFPFFFFFQYVKELVFSCSYGFAGLAPGSYGFAGIAGF
jgi:hypothetical protein